MVLPVGDTFSLDITGISVKLLYRRCGGVIVEGIRTEIVRWGGEDHEGATVKKRGSDEQKRRLGVREAWRGSCVIYGGCYM